MKMNQAFWSTLNVGLFALQDCIALLAVLFIGRFFYKVTTKIKVEDQIVDGNTAMGITKAGYLIGLAIAATGGVWTVPDVQTKSLMIGLVGLFSMILLRLSLIINDKFILSKFDNLNEIVAHQNIGVAFVEAGGTIATGFMIAGAMSGKSDSLIEKLEYGSFYWLLGQAILVISCHIYHFICGHDVDKELVEKNTAAGVAFGGFLAAIGIIVDASMYGVSTNFTDELVTILVLVGIGTSLLVLGKLALSKVLMPTASMSQEISRDKNCGAAALSAVGFVALAIIFSASIAPATTSAAFGSTPPVDDFVDDESITLPATDDDKPIVTPATKDTTLPALPPKPDLASPQDKKPEPKPEEKK